MAATMKDGWRDICGYEVWVEDGKIMRGMVKDRNGSKVAAWPYRACKTGGWSNCSGLSVDAFRAGVWRGTIIMS